MVSSISLRSARKMGGLFDIGPAGSEVADTASFDVSIPEDFDLSIFTVEAVNSNLNDTSFDVSIPKDLEQPLYTFEEVNSNLNATSFDFSIPEDLEQPFFTLENADSNLNASLSAEHFLAPPSTSVNYAPGKIENSSAEALFDLNFDLLDPLGGLDDPLADEDLDAFVNLDSFLMKDCYEFGSQSLETVEVQPVIDVFAKPDVSKEENIPQAGPSWQDNILISEDTVKAASTASMKVKSTAGRKRKVKSATNNIETHIFKLPNVSGISIYPQVDHDYTTIGQEMSGTFEPTEKFSDKILSGTSKQLISSFEHCEIISVPTLNVNVMDTSIDKQKIRRIKNNVASKRSREQRKRKLSDLDLEAESLITANAELRLKIVELEKKAREMKTLLVAKMTGNA